MAHNTKEERVYRLPIYTEKQMAHAERRQREAYEIYNSVQVIPDGNWYVRIICTQPRNQTTQQLALD